MEEKKTKAELLEERAANVAKRAAIIAKAKEEKRSLSQEEVAELEELRSANALIDAKLDEMEERKRDEERKRSARVITAPETPLLRAFREAATGNMSDETRAFFEQGAAEMRRAGVAADGGFNVPVESRATIQAGAGEGSGGAAVQVDEQTILDPLRQNLVLAQAGANVLTGLVGDVEVPTYTGSTSNWKGEKAAADDGAGTFGSKKFQPKRLTTKLELSMQFLMQDSVGAEQMLRRDLLASIQAKLESTALGSGAKGDAPAGIFHGTISNKGAASHNRIVDIIAAVKKKNALKGNLSFITNPEGEAILGKTQIIPGSSYGFLCEDGKMKGYDVLTSTGVASALNTSEEGLVFANWQDFLLCQWGALNFTVDNITKADEGVVRFIINSFWDFGFRRDESAVVASIKMGA